MLCLMCLSSSFFLGNAMIITSKMIIRNRIGMKQDVLVKCRIYFFWTWTIVRINMYQYTLIEKGNVTSPSFSTTHQEPFGRTRT